MDILKEKMQSVKASKSVSIDEIINHIKKSSDAQQKAFLYFLKKANEIEGVELKTRNQGISGYCLNRQGSIREAFHFSVRIHHDDLIVYQLIQVFDPKQIFTITEPGKTRAKYGYIKGDNAEENAYVVEIFKKCVDKVRQS
jgi:hypothetical protein